MSSGKAHENLDNDNDSGGWAPAKHYCPHVIEYLEIPEKLEEIPDLNAPICSECQIENKKSQCWLCLKCYKIFCGRYDQQHMVKHYESEKHCIALGINDLSFWCYKCDSYLHHLAIRPIFTAYQFLHIKKFDEAIPVSLLKNTNFKEHDMFIEYLENKKTNNNDGNSNINSNTDTDSNNNVDDQEEKNTETSLKRNPKQNLVDQRPIGTSGPSTALKDNEITEFFDDPKVLNEKVAQFVELLKKSKHVVVYTGAGISTSANLPDYRGPKGIWTLKAKGEKPKSGITLEQALPTYSHMALADFVEKGLVSFVVSTNVDGLHRRSGIPPEKLSELHGNIYLEYCYECGREYLRTFDVTKKRKGRFTGRLCEDKNCKGKLRDSIINFGENLPEQELINSMKQSVKSDLVIVLGSSMRVSPANNLPSLSYEKGGSFVLVNLQKTPYDQFCNIRIFSKIDDFMKLVCQSLNIHIKPFEQDSIIQELHQQVQNIIVDPNF